MKTLVSLCLCMLGIALIECNSNTKTSTNTDTDTTSTSTSTASNPTANWKIGVQMWTFRMFPFVDAFNKDDSAGVKNIEAFFDQKLRCGIPGSLVTKMSADARAKLKQLLQSKGIQIVAMGVISPKNKD